MSTVGILHKSASKENFQGTNRIFGENVGPPLQKDFRNGGEGPGSPNHDKSHIFGTKREDSEIFFRGNNSLWENGTNGKADIRYEQTGVKDVECSNREKIRELQSSLGKLFRDSTLDGSVWTKEHLQRRVSQTMNLKSNMTVFPCAKCQFVRDSILKHRAIILPL